MSWVATLGWGVMATGCGDDDGGGDDPVLDAGDDLRDDEDAGTDDPPGPRDGGPNDAGGQEDAEPDSGIRGTTCGYAEVLGRYACGGTDPDPPGARCEGDRCCIGERFAAACGAPENETCCDSAFQEVTENCRDDGRSVSQTELCDPFGE
jgi:hypothetical protein